MITPLLKSALSPLVERHRRLRSLYVSGVSWLLAGAVGAGFLLAHASLLSAIAATLGALILALLIGRRWVGNWEPDYRAIARTIEDRHPDLHALLRTAVEQEPDPKSGQLHYLQQRVVAEAVEATRKRQWLDSIPKSRWVGGYAMRALGFAAVLLAFILIKPTPHRAQLVAEKAATKDGVTVTPGDAELEKGSGLVVLAKFQHSIPNEAILVLHPKNQPEQRVALVKNLDDPVFGGGLPEVDADLSYRIEYAGQSTREFSVKVFEHPRLERADATLDFPAYTKLPEKKIPDTHRVSAVEGTKLGIDLQLNKPVKSAMLVGKDGTKLSLAVQADKPLAELRDFPVKTTQTYELQLVDADGRANKLPAQFIVEALPNRRPELKVATPKGDTRVSPIEEVAFRAQVWDDFGLTRYGLSYTIAGGAAREVSLGQETKADERQQLAHLLKLEEIGAKPDELISWYLWAEDTGPDGKPRRTETDMYFAEVRPFEEIFKQGDDSGEESEEKNNQANEAEKLAGSQKEIISATWNVKRREEAAASPTPTEKYLKDEPVVRDSQSEMLAKTKAIGEKTESAKTKALVEAATKEMQAAIDHLNEAEKTPEPLPRALSSEQAAYNALLKLAAHEFNVKKQKASKSGKQAQQRNQQQLDELELKEDKKRYETKSEADSQQNEQQKEQLAVVNRLKELAQRQNDINERVKELQTAMQEAKTEKEKEELRRQLKRLREEEQQVLADVDELRQKMEQSPQQAQLADERKQLDQTRGEAQKAAEAMEKNEASKALASGTRAAREMQQMRDDFRKKTSTQFRDEMRDMRADARDLAEKQQEIADKLKGESAKPARPTLEDNSDREKLGEQFEKQKGQLGKLTEDMKRVSEQAEGAEPLLAKELYDALRKTAQAGTSETLEKTQELAQRGFQPQAQKFEEKARQEIDELKTDVEKAAESVLGDEGEALRQARAELDTLTKQLDREIAQARPDLAQNNPDGKRTQLAGAGDSKASPSESAEPQDKQTATGGAPGEASAAGRESRPPKEDAQRTAQGKSQSKQPGENGKEPGKEAGADGKPSDEAQEGQQPGQTAKNDAGKPGDKPGNKPGQGQKGGGQQPGKGEETAQNGEAKPGDQPGTQPGENGSGKQPGKGAQATAAAGGKAGGGGDGKDPDANEPSGNQNARPGARLADLAGAANQRGAAQNGGGGGAFNGGPLTGDNFVDWQDRLRNVEEMLDQPAMRNEAARVREVAKGVRAETRKLATTPDWDLVNTKIRAPLAELRNRVTEELARRESKENLVPIDRDPVPTKYAERVRRYYEDLGRSN